MIVKVLIDEAFHVQTTACKYSFKVNGTQSHRHLPLVGIDHATRSRPIQLRRIVLWMIHHRRGLNPFFLSDFLNIKNTYPSIQIQQPGQFFYHSGPIPWLPIKDVASQLKFLQIGQFGEFFDIVEFGYFVRIGEQVLQSE